MVPGVLLQLKTNSFVRTADGWHGRFKPVVLPHNFQRPSPKTLQQWLRENSNPRYANAGKLFTPSNSDPLQSALSAAAPDIGRMVNAP